MGLRLQNQIFGECFFVTTSFLDHQPLGCKPGVYEILATAVNYQLDETGAKLLAYVFMPTHLHLILLINGGLLSEFVRDFKKYTSQKALADFCASRRAWQSRYDRQALWSENVLLTKVEYIHNNPVKAGLVQESTAWYWSSAAAYAEKRNGPLAVWKEW